MFQTIKLRNSYFTSQPDTCKSATARIFSNHRNSATEVTSYDQPANQGHRGSTGVYVAQAYSDYSDPKDSIGGPPSGSSPTAHAYSSGHSNSISGSASGANVWRSASSVVGTKDKETRDKNSYVQSDWNISYTQTGVYMPNKDGGYTRVSQDAIGNANANSGGGAPYGSPYSNKPYGHGVFIARRLSDAGSIPESDQSKKPERRLSVAEARPQYEDLDAISANRLSYPPASGASVKRTVSDLSHLRCAPAAVEPIYARAIKRESSRDNPGAALARPESPSSPPPPPVPPPPPISPVTPSANAQAPTHHESTMDAVKRVREEMQARRLSRTRSSTTSDVGSGHGYDVNEGEFTQFNSKFLF